MCWRIPMVKSHLYRKPQLLLGLVAIGTTICWSLWKMGHLTDMDMGYITPYWAICIGVTQTKILSLSLLSPCTKKGAPLLERGGTLAVHYFKDHLALPPFLEVSTSCVSIMLMKIYLLYDRASTALKLTFEVCPEIRKHMEILPKTGFIQAHSSFSAQLKFLPR